MFGVALEGGGAKGAYHIGAIRALIENGCKIDGVVGTSIGAFNAALVAQNDFEKAYEIWNNMQPSMLFNIEDNKMETINKSGFTKESLRYLSEKAKEIIMNRGIDTSKLRTVVDSLVFEEEIRKSEVDFGMVTVSISDLTPLEILKDDIPQGKLKDYIMASANFPLFKSQPIDNKYYIDGGIYNNCPINLLADKGYTNVVAVRTSQKEKLQQVKCGNCNVINIIPSEDLGGTLIFDNDLIKRNIKMGYYDTIRVMKCLKGKRYYIEPANEDLFFNIINNIPNEIIFNIGKIFKFTNMNSKRMLFEGIIPTIAELLKLPKTATYEEIFIELMEVIAAERNVEKFKVYTINSFIEAIETSMPVEDKENRKYRNLLNLKRLATELLGTNMLDEVAYVIFDTLPLELLKIK